MRTAVRINANNERRLIDLEDDLIANVVYTGVGNKRKVESRLVAAVSTRKSIQGEP